MGSKSCTLMKGFTATIEMIFCFWFLYLILKASPERGEVYSWNKLLWHDHRNFQEIDNWEIDFPYMVHDKSWKAKKHLVSFCWTVFRSYEFLLILRPIRIQCCSGYCRDLISLVEILVEVKLYDSAESKLKVQGFILLNLTFKINFRCQE